MRSALLTAIAALALAGSAAAQERLALSRAVFVERSSADGLRSVAPARTLRRGDTVLLMVEWTAPASGRSFTVASAVPRALAFQRSSADVQAVSVDGGRSWGQIGSLLIGNRLASVEDVTHLRWQVQPGTQGRLTYSAVVR